MTYEQIKPYIEKGYISERPHPEDNNIRIFNYTQTCQFDKAWDDVTKNCRGLVMNIATGEILYKPFGKMFNYSEYLSNNWEVPQEEPLITEKLDGSLGILCNVNGKPWIATRGSFESEQAKWATNYYRKHINKLPPEGETMLFEIIYPQNRIVVEYDFSGLVFIVSLNTKTGEVVPREGLFPRELRKVANTDLNALASMDTEGAEGFVVFFPKANLRMKIKFPEYVRIHKLVTGVSEIAIWEHLRAGNKLDDLVKKVPDEFFNWVRSVQNNLNSEFNHRWNTVNFALNMMYGYPDRKSRALYIMAEHKEVAGSIFSMLDGQEDRAREEIWKKIRPHGVSQFKNDGNHDGR